MIGFGNFHQLDPSVRQVASELLANAQQVPPSFMSFTYRWMAFNGWMSAVTLEDRDWKMVAAIAADARLTAAHDALMATTSYRGDVEVFALLWPVFNVRDVRRKFGYGAFMEYDRAALLAASVQRLPDPWVAGDVPAWEPVIRAIYQVRCNMFHGQKSPQSLRDRQLVLASDAILCRFIAESGCFDWTDQ